MVMSLENQKATTFMKLCTVGAASFWVLDLILQIFLLLYPYILYYEKGLETVNICGDIYDDDQQHYKKVEPKKSKISTLLLLFQPELLRLEVFITNRKFSAHGLLELEWSVVYLIIAWTTTHIVCLVQFAQIRN
ncbi:hypothetical protein Zmor_010089 [Zophobas morio]|uniref:Uncharacterized protein n=1 Tax=Zophobas morio TaxID=2755281 RepID=A0AA38IMI8_9CUCU|nr:hypothetical protein Zmor_010089 [Zophobas morio]